MAKGVKENCADLSNAEKITTTAVVLVNGDLCEKGKSAAGGNALDAKSLRLLFQRLPLDLICLSAVLVVVWGLLLLPIIYFHTEIRLDSDHDNSSSPLSGSVNGNISNGSECINPCGEDFFCLEESGICVPACSTWSDSPRATAKAIDVLVILFACIGLLSAVGVLVVSCVRYKHVFTFPSIFVLYETITIIVLLVLFLLNYMDRESLYCSSSNLLDSIYETSTPFCTISGIVLYYCMLQLNLWWVFHVTILFWKIRFPIHALRFSHTMGRIHAVCVVLGLTIPLLPVLTTIIHSLAVDYSATEGLPSGLGFGLATFPPILCYTLNKDVVFFSFILPITLLMVMGITLLLLTIWAVHKQHGLFKAKSPMTMPNPSVSVAEKKLLLVFLYFFLLAVVSYTGFSLFHRKVERYSTELKTYFECEQRGHDPANPCNRGGFEHLSFPGATAVAFILIELSPIVNFVFIINFQDMKAAVASWTSQK